MSFLLEFIMFLLDYVGSCSCFIFVFFTFILCFKLALYMANSCYAIIRNFFIRLRSRRAVGKEVEEKQ